MMTSTAVPGNRRELYSQRIELAIQYIDQHLASELDLETVARAAGFSPFHFHRIFSAMTGETPQDFVNRLRLERAANLLVKNPHLSITEVAHACGFGASSAFSRSFKRYFGVTARAYVAQNTSSGRPPAWVAARPARVVSAPVPFEIQIVKMPALHLAILQARRGYAQESVKEVWNRLFLWAGAHQLLTPEAQLAAVSYDDPEITEPEKCRYYAGVTVPESLTNDPQVSFLDIPALTCAVCRLNCDADQIQPAYRVLYRDWLPESGYLLADFPPYEIYRNAPEVDPNSKYVLDVCIPLDLPG